MPCHLFICSSLAHSDSNGFLCFFFTFLPMILQLHWVALCCSSVAGLSVSLARKTFQKKFVYNVYLLASPFKEPFYAEDYK